MAEMTDGLYRILSLDGGGSWSLIQVRTLMALFPEAKTGHDIAKRFDLIAANSGGSIVAAGLAADLPLETILTLFEDESTRRQIFIDVPWYKKNSLFAILGLAPKYSTPAKLLGLDAVFKNHAPTVDVTTMTLPEVAGAITKGPDWLITTFDYDRRRATFFRSNQTSTAAGTPSGGRLPTFIGAVHAASTAPVLFFNRPAENGDLHRYWDGAVGGYNNPVLAAVTEALANGVPPDSIRAISLGTASVFLPTGPGTPTNLFLQPQTPSTIRDAKEMAASIVDDPPDAASFIAHTVLGGHTGGPFPVTNGPLVRLSPLIQPVRSLPDGPWTLPKGISSNDFDALCSLQLDAVDQRDVELINTLCAAWMTDDAANQPIRASRALDVEIGHARFGAALGAASQIIRRVETDPATQPEPGAAGV